MVNKPGAKVASYARVSTQDQAENGLSLEAQRAKIEGYCQLHELKLIHKYEDAGLSAKSVTHRPEARKVIELVRKGKIEGVVIYKLDRLFRRTRDAVEFAELCQKKGVALHSISENLDTDSPMGQFFFVLTSGLAELERRQIGERTAMALRHKRDLSEKLGGTCPFGYTARTVGKGHKAVKKLISNKAEQRTIKLMKRLRSNGKSLRAIVAELAKRKIRTKTGKKQWSVQAVRKVLADNS